MQTTTKRPGRFLALAAALAGLAAAGSARADDYAYMGTGTANFGVVDLTTGVYTSCGTSGAQLSGLGVGPDHAIYGGGFRARIFYRVAPTTGTLTPIGTSNITFFITGSTTKGVYAVDLNSNLYSIDITTGAATLIGPTGVPAAGSGGYWGMSTNSKTLYYSYQSGLYKVNVKTGRGALIGTASAGVFGAEVLEDGKLFAGSENPLGVYTLNPRNGSSTFVAPLTGSGSGPFWGLVPIKAKRISAKKICAAHKL